MKIKTKTQFIEEQIVKYNFSKKSFSMRAHISYCYFVSLLSNKKSPGFRTRQKILNTLVAISATAIYFDEVFEIVEENQ